MDEIRPKGPRPLKKLYESARAFMVKNPATLLVWHLLIISVGLVFLISGLIMLIVPGPGTLFIILGIFVLSTEYSWAKRAMGQIRSIIETASRWWQDPTLRRIRRQTLVIFGLVVAAMVGWYTYEFGVSFEGFRELEQFLTR